MIGRLIGSAVIGYVAAKHGDNIGKAVKFIKDKLSNVTKSNDTTQKVTVSNDKNVIVIDGVAYKKIKDKNLKNK